jgi:hypothetical protein
LCFFGRAAKPPRWRSALINRRDVEGRPRLRRPDELGAPAELGPAHPVFL